MTARLIINADDYGRSPDISRGIRFSHLHGLVTSCTCMMNMPSVVNDIRLALNETPRLGLGVHLVLTAGKPLLPVSNILGLTGSDGNFLKLSELIDRAPGLNPAVVKAEWRAQIEAFINAIGKKPTHLDSYEHSSNFTPVLLSAMFEIAHEYNLPTRLPLAHGQNPYMAGFSEELVDEIVEFTPQILEKFQPRSPDAFFASFYDEQATRTEFMQILSHFLPNGTFEIMCHPGYINEDFAKISGYTFQRETELKILTDPSLRMEVEKRGIELISFTQL